MTDEQYDGIIEAIENQNSNKYTKCSVYDKTKTEFENKNLKFDGSIENENGTNVTDFIYIKGKQLTEIQKISYDRRIVCFYNIDKTFTRCLSQNNIELNQIIDVLSDEYYVRLAVRTGNNTPRFKICQTEIQAIEVQSNKINDITSILVIGLGLLLVITLLLRRVNYR